MSLKELYHHRSIEFTTQAKSLKEKFIRYSFIRLILFIVGFGVMIVLGTTAGWLAGIGFIILFLLAFARFVAWHQKMQARQHHLEFLSQVNTLEGRCLEHDFSDFASGQQYLDPHHPYSVDLDLFGAHSFFQYINRTTTSIGQTHLASYLQKAASSSEIRSRHEAVAELSAMLDWRQDFQAYGLSTEDDSSHIQALRIWMQEPDFVRNNRALQWAFYLIPIWVIGGCLLVHFYLPWQAYLLVAALPGWILKKNLEQVNKTHIQTTHADKILSFYARLIAHIEQQKGFAATKLQKLQAVFLKKQPSASVAIRRLSYIISQLNVRYNAFAIILNLLVLWDLQWVYRLEKWKAAQRDNLEDWFAALQEFEALQSFANLHYNNPDWVFPKMVDEGPVVAEALGHPLITEAKRICNDVDLPTTAHIKLITGSNMAGKSTFLRTVGLNIVMAMSGAPVCARQLRLPPLKVYTSMRTQDALHESTSSFYAELKRLKFIIEGVEHNQPDESGVFFLLDEILKGTNSRDRHAGSKALIRQLIKSKGAGIIATHDLELGALEAESEGAIENLCIEVEVKGEDLIFDYKVKKGVSQSFNATQLMKRMGIRMD